MTNNRLDEIFSVVRLRRTWGGLSTTEEDRETPAADTSGKVPGAAASALAGAFCGKLRATIHRCFSAGCVSAVEPLLVEIERLLEQRFPAGGAAGPDRKESAEITMALDGLLDRLEDLLEAFEVGAGSHF